MNVPFYAIACPPGKATPETPLLFVVEIVSKNYGQCVLAHMKAPGKPWTPWRHLYTCREISPAPECFEPIHPCPWGKAGAPA